MSDAATAPVVAAGAVCWRETKQGGVEVLLISRSRHDDVSLPKGKVDPGETVPETAVREIREETGYSVALGAPLGTTEYTLPNGRDKVVYYWAAEIDREQLSQVRFRPNDEVDRVEWVPIAKATKKLTYKHDDEVLDRFRALVDRGAHRTFALIALRHAKAASTSDSGSDADRPLTTRGKHQANAVANILAAWAPRSIDSSPAKRCLSTVRPFSKSSGVEVKTKRALSQGLWESGSDRDPQSALTSLLAKRIENRATALLCTHSPVLPPLLDSIAAQVGGERDGRLTRAAILSTAEFTVVHLSAANPTSGIVAIESHAPLT